MGQTNWRLTPPTAARIRTWMQQQGLRACELAGRLDWSQASMTRVLNGERAWGVDRRLKFVELYGVDVYRNLFGQAIPEYKEAKLRDILEGANNDCASIN